MARGSDSDDDDADLHGWPRVIDALGIGLLVAGCGLSYAAIFGAAVGGLSYGVAMTCVGLLTRAGAYACAAWDIDHTGVVVPKQRPARDGRAIETELDAVRELERDQADSGTRFVAMLEEQTERSSARGRHRGGW